MPRRIPFHRPAATIAARETTRRVYEDTPERRADKAFYGSARWLKLRRVFLSRHPLCAECERNGRVTAAAHVHHKTERKDDPSQALAWDNLEALCQPCHNGMRRQIAH